MGSRETVTATVRHLMAQRNMRTAELAALMGVERGYAPRKLLHGRWTLDDLDVLSTIFKVPVGDIVSGEAVKTIPTPPPGHGRLYEITFDMVDGVSLTCLEQADSSGAAIQSITSVWRPGSEIANVTTKEKWYFSVNIPSLTRSSR
jgi:hypothetical protein